MGVSSTVITEFGKGVDSKIYQALSYRNSLRRKLYGEMKKEVRNVQEIERLQALIDRSRGRVKHIMDDMQWHTIKYLCMNHEIILFPPLNVQQISRRLSSPINQALFVLSFGIFRKRFEYTVNVKVNDVRVIQVNEHYTSKTCGCCLNLHPHLGGTRIYICPKCWAQIGRDVNGARNVLVKWLVDGDEKSRGKGVAFQSPWANTPQKKNTITDDSMSQDDHTVPSSCSSLHTAGMIAQGLQPPRQQQQRMESDDSTAAQGYQPSTDHASSC